MQRLVPAEAQGEALRCRAAAAFLSAHIHHCIFGSYHHINCMSFRYMAILVGVILVTFLLLGKNELAAAREDAGYRLQFVDCAAGVPRGCARMDWVCVRDQCAQLPTP